MSEDRRQRGKQASARKKAPAKAGKKRAGRAGHAPKLAKAPRTPAATRARPPEPQPMAAVREPEPAEWAREPADTAAMFDAMGPDEHPGYLTTGARRLVARLARATLAPLALARAVLDRLRDRS